MNNMAWRRLVYLTSALIFGAGSVFGDPIALIHAFKQYDVNDGYYPASIMQGNDGFLYGTTARALNGTVFKVNTNGASFASLLDFVYQANFPYDGYEPYYGLCQGLDGNLYGSTTEGAGFSAGVIYRISTVGSFKNLYSFPNGGGQPSGKMVQGNDGNFYGVTRNAPGTVFRVTPQGTLTTTHTFSGPDGNSPVNVIKAIDGFLYGTTTYGGLYNKGTIFKISTQGVFTTLYSFLGGSAGYSPMGGLVQGLGGNLYGTTKYGGAYIALDTSGYGFGTIFRITTNGSFTTLASFNNTNGANPIASMVQTSDGVLYGIAEAGLAKYNPSPGVIDTFGCVFRLGTNNTITVPVTFDWMNGYGADPSDLILGKDGKIYGSVARGGNAYGVYGGFIYSLNPQQFTDTGSGGGLNSYSGIFRLVKCKKGYSSEGGVFQFTAILGGNLSGTFSNVYGEGVIVGSISSKGKCKGTVHLGSGQTGKFKGKIDSKGMLTGKATATCKWTFVGSKN